MDNKGTKKPRQITGRFVLVCFIVFFGVIFAANAIMMYLAIGTFPGLEVESTYEVSQGYNDEIALAETMKAKAWKVEADIKQASDGSVQILVLAQDKNGAPVYGDEFTVKFQRPTSTNTDTELTLQEQEAGRYVGNIAELGHGNWTVVVEAFSAESAETPVFRSRNKVFFKEQ
ncbi:FixH family protein [Pseudovibrio sp. SPO723]|nr:FixH family protein [Pseudovibrio sp. SPO723]MDX5593217.1 FixH family protein [Pseudovibrio sp. SPO723]